ncbi:TonB family protein [Myxococcus sp. AM011]|uniref:TonB family protein n=1 Tax=Myxococcus sp. AM011 TaxID=2745200 RepID=UPI001595E09B|nr:TonB family protein [Myxococcus sp. AM011]NVJ23470.1 TonB family protein [Myxococcus sp. AM011]
MLVLCAVGALEEPPISPPVPVEAVAPVMPGDAPVLEHPATVMLRLTIDDGGAVSRVEVRESAGTVFDRAAMGAAVRWRFEPALRGGVPLEVQVDVPVQFAPARVREALTGVAGAERASSESARATTEDTSRGEMLSAPASTEPVGGAVDVPTRESSPLDVLEASKPSAGASSPGFSTTVRGVAEAPPPVAVGDFHIEVGQLADVPRNSASDLMLLAPGVMLANHGGEGHAETVFIRGFDAGEGKDVEMRLNGVPLNEVSHAHGHGYADTYFIIPELVDSLRVTEGPYDASQGDFGVAGTVEYQLGLARRGLTASASYGSFASRRLALVWGPPESTEATFVGLLLRQGQGFGPNRSFANATAMAQVELRLGDDTRLRLLGASSGARFASAGVVRETDVVDARLPCAADADSQFFCFYEENQGGASQRHLVSAELQSRLKRGGRMVQQGYVVLRQTRIRDNFTGFIQDTPPGEDAQRGDGTEGYYRGSTLGLRGRYIPGLTLLGQSRPLELGYVARYDDVRTRSRRLRDSGGAPYSTLFDNQVRTTNLGGYASLRVQPLDWLALRVGVRLDTFLFGVEDLNRPAVDRDGSRIPEESLEAYGFFASPRASAEVKLSSRLTWLTSAGLGARSSDAAALSDAELAPYARVASGETGLGWKREGEARPYSLEARGAVFATRVSQDFVFDERLGRNQPIGASQRLGAFATGRLRWADWLDAQASVAWARATLPVPGASSWKLWDGAVMPYIPALLGRVDASVRGHVTVGSERLGWNVALGHSAVGPRPLPLNRYSEPVFLFDVGTRARWDWMELGVSVENVLDARWRETELNYVSNFRGPDAPASLLATRHFSAGAPRTFRGTLTLYLDFEEDAP